MFRRTKPEPVAPAPEVTAKTGGKGRPTPKRREAEAAAKARAKAQRTRKDQAAARRGERAEANRKLREAMRTGDDRHLPQRDRGPVRRFIRDFVDVRFSFVELLLPMLVVSMVLGYVASPTVAGYANAVLMGTLLLVVVDMLLMRFRLRRELTRRFPGEPLKGTTYYAVTRALQMKFMRLPKAQVKFGQRLPDHRG